MSWTEIFTNESIKIQNTYLKITKGFQFLQELKIFLTDKQFLDYRRTNERHTKLNYVFCAATMTLKLS